MWKNLEVVEIGQFWGNILHIQILVCLLPVAVFKLLDFLFIAKESTCMSQSAWWSLAWYYLSKVLQLVAQESLWWSYEVLFLELLVTEICPKHENIYVLSWQNAAFSEGLPLGPSRVLSLLRCPLPHLEISGSATGRDLYTIFTKDIAPLDFEDV